MGQITSGLRAILSFPKIYSAFQDMMGARSTRLEFVEDFVRPEPGSSVLDVGCGPAKILDYLPAVKYWGFDISAPYINQAKLRFDKKGHFYCKMLDSTDLDRLTKFDVVLALGMLHHLGDNQAAEVMRLAHQALKVGGRFLSLDPCLEKRQSRIARFLVLRDRGQNVRTADDYTRLAARVFSQVRGEVRHQAWIPYTRFMMECTRL